MSSEDFMTVPSTSKVTPAACENDDGTVDGAHWLMNRTTVTVAQVKKGRGNGKWAKGKGVNQSCKLGRAVNEEKKKKLNQN